MLQAVHGAGRRQSLAFRGPWHPAPSSSLHCGFMNAELSLCNPPGVRTTRPLRRSGAVWPASRIAPAGPDAAPDQENGNINAQALWAQRPIAEISSCPAVWADPHPGQRSRLRPSWFGFRTRYARSEVIYAMARVFGAVVADRRADREAGSMRRADASTAIPGSGATMGRPAGRLIKRAPRDNARDAGRRSAAGSDASRAASSAGRG
jgi:hypothetical protein